MTDSVSSPLSPPPSPPGQGRNKMKQSAAKSVRMTEEGNPFTKELGELFASLVVTLPMDAHRVRFTKVEETFTSEEAIMNLGSLKSSQSHRMPDPKDPTRWVVTTAITTFSMPKEMARSVCQRFLDARFIESADGRLITSFTSKGGIWQLTPKGVNIVHRWCSRIGVNSRQLEPLLRRDQMHLVVLERDELTDKLSQDKSTIEVIFRRFAGQDGPNVKGSVQSSDSDSIHDYETGLVGVKVAKDRKVSDRVIANTFTGKAASDWLLDCCTTIDRRETYQIAELFIKHKLIWTVMEDRVFIHQHPRATLYQPTKNAIYAFTERGQKLCGWPDKNPRTSTAENSVKKDAWASKDSNTTRLNTILQDPALRLLFREFLRQSLCEENLTFYQDVREFTTGYRQLESARSLDKADAVQETLAAAYGTYGHGLIEFQLTGVALYNAFLAPNAPCELNIDHTLRNNLALCMVRPLGNEDTMLRNLQEVVELFELAQNSVYKLMSSVRRHEHAFLTIMANFSQDSVPKFVRDPRYNQVLREYEFDDVIPERAYSPTSTVPERSTSRSTKLS